MVEGWEAMAKFLRVIICIRPWMFLSLAAVIAYGCGNGAAGISPAGTMLPNHRPLPETATPEVELPFETIDRAEWPGARSYYEEEGPGLFILTSPDDIPLIDHYISKKALAEVKNQDFEQVLVIAVFQGEKPTNQYGVEVYRVARRGDTITIYTQFDTPKPDIEKIDVVTSPYHVIRIQKDSLKGDCRFSIVAVGKEIIHQNRSLQ